MAAPRPPPCRFDFNLKTLNRIDPHPPHANTRQVQTNRHNIRHRSLSLDRRTSNSPIPARPHPHSKDFTLEEGTQPTFPRRARNFDGWSNVKAELEALTTEIDLSEQLHVVFECLTRIAQAFQEQFKGELSLGVDAFTEIVGNLDDYGSPPLLAKITRKHPFITMDMMELEIERFLQAQRLVAGRTFRGQP